VASIEQKVSCAGALQKEFHSSNYTILCEQKLSRCSQQSMSLLNADIPRCSCASCCPTVNVIEWKDILNSVLATKANAEDHPTWIEAMIGLPRKSTRLSTQHAMEKLATTPISPQHLDEYGQSVSHQTEPIRNDSVASSTVLIGRKGSLSEKVKSKRHTRIFFVKLLVERQIKPLFRITHKF
jgi:hypothetical protein